ncbi:uncharacterized protein LOC108595913 [Drosophila busckii]|uniref:uncharacterized protein LOC108595913 n=1 Tax=Drosophila busckii TaxID=30019 RepID=UPI0014328BC7|nr:uncharacterized protein LOC108595913 [Drosophila busckii]
MVPVTKPNTKEVQCQLSTGEESPEQPQSPEQQQQQQQQPEVIVTPKSGRVGIFNAEDFLSRAQRNDKINNILRSPTKAPNGVRQRSVYTNNNPSPQASLRLPMSQASLSSRMSSMSLNSSSASVGTNTSVLAKECSSQTNAGGSYRAMQLGMHHSPSQPLLSAITPDIDPSNIIRGGKSLTARYPGHYSFENTGAYIPPQPQPPIHHSQQFPSPMPPPPHALGRVSSRTFEFENSPPPPPPCRPAMSKAPTSALRMVSVTPFYLYIKCFYCSLSRLGQGSAVRTNAAWPSPISQGLLIHPNGRILQSGSKVEIVTYDGMKANNFVRYAKMWYKGVSFTSESCALIYLVDTAGTRTTTDTFTDLTKDYTLAVFYDDSRHGPSFVPDAQEVIAKSTYACADDGTETYDINGFRIIQAADGLVKVTRQHNKGLIRTSPGNGSVTLTTLGIHCTASLGKTSHLFLRRNEKRMHFDGSNFIVRNAGHSAGFNENNLLIVY